MHTLFLLSAILLAAVVGGVGALALRVALIGGRRPLALAVLAGPPFVLAVAAFHLVPRFWPACALLVGWDRAGSLGLLFVLGLTALGALALNLARLAMAERLLRACPPLADEDLTARVAGLASRLGVSPPLLRLLGTDAPFAVAGGLRPTIVLSRWLVEHLDSQELDGVLAHELAHLKRRDHLARWLGRLLRDATVYLPGGWYAWRVLQADEELTADFLAVEATGRPLAMATALGKVWRDAALSPDVAGLPPYSGTSVLLEERLCRLLNGRTRRPSTIPGRLLVGVSMVLIGGLAPQLLVAVSTLWLVCNLQPL